MNQCPSCSFESQCETILVNHISSNHESLALLAEITVDNKSSICFCINCSPKILQIEETDIVTLPEMSKNEIKEELFPDDFATEDTILVDPFKFEPNKWFTCNQCPYKCKERSKLTRHNSLKHLNEKEIVWYTCDQCPYQTKQKSTLKNHYKHRHLPPDEIKWFQCQHCVYKTKTKSCLAYHQFQHASPENIQWFKCNHCDYKAKTRSRLNKHVSELHSPPGDIKWLKCEHCLMYVTRRNSSLKLHIKRKHSGVVT
ncbi:RE1-silencing transcription factor [Tribolium castaneum]|uniref:Zinc finger Y-chromosomal protein-like Protein n=1 Tax=Tribolium castaneum TaxID=7070 RepID=D6WWG4_TRICA|nr:PREDICTED: RE1-silencing transcription factor [Tribolium castaneum]EFA08138.1 Zinc finger Y-chromosomal protein-like Protein [Tribolium castaneum]|eukprot:XP_008196886.1 PREDICTED: RE1-silencing transcription factor [Tribolium castaneum]